MLNLPVLGEFVPNGQRFVTHEPSVRAQTWYKLGPRHQEVHVVNEEAKGSVLAWSQGLRLKRLIRAPLHIERAVWAQFPSHGEMLCFLTEDGTLHGHTEQGDVFRLALPQGHLLQLWPLQDGGLLMECEQETDIGLLQRKLYALEHPLDCWQKVDMPRGSESGTSVDLIVIDDVTLLVRLQDRVMSFWIKTRHAPVDVDMDVALKNSKRAFLERMATSSVSFACVHEEQMSER
jgi:hypothetical protein